MFWLRQHIFPLVESFQDRERSPGAESFRSALSDGAESFYSALSDHRSSVYYDAESSDLNSSDSDSRYADVDEEPCPEQMPALVTEFEEAAAKESTLDEAYESFSYGKLFEDVYGTVVHRPPLLKCQQKHQDNKNEKQPPRRWRPLPCISVKSDLPQENLVTCASSEVPAHHKSLPAEFSRYMKQEQDEQEMNDDELRNEMQEESITSSFFYLEQAAEEFAEFIVEEAKYDACRCLVETSALGKKKRMAKLGSDNLSNDGACKTHVLDHSVIGTNDPTLHPVTSEDRDILDAFNRQFEPCFDSEEEPDSQAFENASEEEADCMEHADLEEKGLLNRNALLGTFKRFPQPALDSLHHEHSFSDSSRTGGSSRHRPTSFLPTTSSASELTDKYWRRYSSDTADTAATQYKRLDSVDKNFLSSDPDISKYCHLKLSNGYADSTMISVPDTAADVSSFAEPAEEAHDSLKDANAYVQARHLPVTYSNRLVAEGPSELYPIHSSCELLHENRSSVSSSAQENYSALLNEQPKPPHRSPRHSNVTPPSLLEEQPKPPPRSPRHSNVPPPSPLEEPPKPPPRSPRHSNITPPSQYLLISPEGADVHRGPPLEANTQVDNQVHPDSGLCVKNHLKAPARRRRPSLGHRAPKGILLDGNALQKETSTRAVGHQCSEDSHTFTKQGRKEELVGQDRPQTFVKEFQHGEMCYESDEDSSLSSCEDSGTDGETSTREILKQSAFQVPENDEEPPTSEILRLPFSLSELSRHLFEDDSPLDVVSFNVVENCDFLNDACSGSAPYMMKLGPNDDLSAFLVDPGTNEHPQAHDSDIDSVFEDTTFEPLHECNLDSVHSGCLPMTENHAKCDEDVEDRQSLGSQPGLTKSVFDIPTRPLRKQAYPSLKNKEPPVSSMDVQLQDKLEPELTCSDTASPEETASTMTANIPCVSQGTDTSHVQHMEESQNSMHMRVVTSQEHSVLGADVHGQTDTLEVSGNERNAAAATTLSGSVASSPLPTSCSYQEVPGAGAECDKLPGLEKTSGDSFFGRGASVNADSSCDSTFSRCVKEEHDKMVMQEVKLVEGAPIELLQDVFLKEYADFAEDKQKHGGSSRGLSQTLNNQNEPKVPGECQPPLDKGSSTNGRLVHVLGRTQEAVKELCNVERGIQGHHNSCYLDATLFAMFSCTYIFDDILNRERQSNDIEEYDRIQKVLREDIVDTLRRDLYVPSKNVMRLRELLDCLGGVSGLTTEEKDPEEFLNSLFYALRVQPFLKLSSQQETHLYQLFVAKNELLEIPTVQQLFHQSIHESKLKLKEIPKALIIQMPRCGKQFKLYDHIVPSLKLDITDALENSPRFCYVCGRQATQECWNCFRPDVGLECTSYCDSCNKTVHQHQDREGHKQTALSNDRFGEDAQPRRQVMTLFAVVCIETSHYVCFVKCPVEDGKHTHTWCFFDSMADREGGEDGHNIPKVDNYMEADTWFGPKGLEKLRDMARPDKTKLLPGMTRRLLCDAYLCMYQDEFAKKYK